MKKSYFIICFFFVFIFSFFHIAYLNAAIHFVTKANSVASQENIKPCFILGYTKTVSDCQKQDLELTDFCPSDSKYGKSCTCNKKKFIYDTSNCAKQIINGDTYFYAPSGNSCDGKYESCDCDSNVYKYNSLNCNSPKAISGAYCNGKAPYCSCPAKYSQTCTANLEGVGTACDGKYESCKCKSNFIDCGGQKGAAGASSCTDSTGIKYTSCQTLTCESGGYVTSIPSGQTCTTVAYNGLSCYKDCRATCQRWVEINYPSLYSSTYFANTVMFTTSYKGTLYGPKYYSYSECQNMTTPTLTFSSLKIDDKETIVFNNINVTVSSDIYIYYGRMEINKGSFVTCSTLNVNQAGYTPTYYATTGAHIYGELKATTSLFHAGQVNVYSEGSFTSSSWNVAASSSWPGRVRYDAEAKVSLSGTCKKASTSGEYKIQSKITSNPVVGSGC